MIPGDVIYEHSIYKVKFVKTLISKYEKEAVGYKGFQFALLKNDEPYKTYSIATGFPYNYELMKSTVINIFKKLML